MTNFHKVSQIKPKIKTHIKFHLLFSFIFSLKLQYYPNHYKISREISLKFQLSFTKVLIEISEFYCPLPSVFLPYRKSRFYHVPSRKPRSVIGANLLSPKQVQIMAFDCAPKVIFNPNSQPQTPFLGRTQSKKTSFLKIYQKLR